LEPPGEVNSDHMNILTELLQVFIYVFLAALISPVFWLVILLAFIQYRRISKMEQRLFGRTINKVWLQTITSLGYGVLGGFLASLILVALGLSLEQIGLYFIWPVALILLLIHPRFLCFAYAGGIVGAAALLARLAASIYPEIASSNPVDELLKVQLPALLVLISLLHLIEAFLIYLGGHKGSTPLYYKKPGGDVVGGFSMQRFWPMPLVALIMMVVLQTEISGVSMPEWWPLLKSSVQPGAGENLQYMAVPVAAGLGYADLALSSTPREKSLFSAKILALYSAALLSAALAAEFYPLFAVPGVLLAPLGHEMLIHYGHKMEMMRRPLYQADSGGAQILMVLPDSAADQAGLMQGDLICRVNGLAVSDYQELLARIEESYFLVLLEGTRGEEAFSVIFKKKKADSAHLPEPLPAGQPFTSPAYGVLHRAADLGLIMVPSRHSRIYVENRRIAPLGWLRRLTRRKK